METTLAEVADVAIGRQRSPKNAAGKHMARYLRSANVKEGRLELDDVLEMNFNPREQSSFALLPGDVLVSEGSASRRQVGASAVWRGELPGVVCFQNTLLRFRAKPDVTDARFLAAWASHAHQSGKFAEMAGGSSILHIGLERASAMRVRWPTLPEQQRIADIVGALDLGLDALAAEILAVEDMLMQQRQALDFGEDVPLGDLLLSIESGKSVLTAGEAPLEGLPRILKLSAVRPAEFSGTEAKALDKSTMMPLMAAVHDGDLLITRSNTPERVGYCARARQVPEGTYMPDLIWRLRLDEQVCDPDYFEQAMASPEMRSRVTSTASGTSASMRKINKKGIAAVRLPLPALSDQRTYADDCLSLASLRSALKYERQALDALRSRLIENLLGGVVSVPESYDAMLGQAS